MTKKGILLINLGTPADCTNTAVYRYLTEFLNDPRVIDLPFAVRWPLVNLLIVPLRFRKTAAAYRKIWTEAGSPLLTISQQLTHLLQQALGADYQVELAMRYGKPNIEAALAKLAGVAALTVIPLFPQYASAATGSAVEECLEKLAKQWNIPALTIVRDFYDHPTFIDAYANRIKQTLQEKNVDLILFSYHGLPERHIQKSHCAAQCDLAHACPSIDATNRYCYRAQCYATTRAIAAVLNLSPSQYQVSFQSRLGRTPWIKPYTDLLLPTLIQKGIKKIAVVCPSFVTDCLETLEEVNLRTRKQWVALGGEEFIFVPCLNESSHWVQALVEMSQ